MNSLQRRGQEQRLCSYLLKFRKEIIFLGRESPIEENPVQENQLFLLKGPSP